MTPGRGGRGGRRFPGPELPPGRTGALTEAEWFAALEELPLLHQWGSALLVDEGPDGCVRVYVRDVTGAGRHAVVRLDEAGSRVARDGVAAVEDASRAAADLVTAGLEGGSTLDELRRQDEASARFVALAEALYARLLGAGPADAAHPGRTAGG